jgi:pseudouridine-5'-phosphate glycosidase
LIERAGASFDVSARAGHLDEIAELVTRLVHSMLERPALSANPTGEQCEILRRWITAAVGGILVGNAESARGRGREQ